MEYVDIFVALIFFSYCLSILLRLLYITYQHSRFEFNEHKVSFIVNAAALITSIPLIMLGIYYWMTDFNGFEVNQWEFYIYYISHTLPTVIYIFIRPDEDCFNCFNRQAPRTYSYFQYTVSEIRRRDFSESDLFNNLDVYGTSSRPSTETG